MGGKGSDGPDAEYTRLANEIGQQGYRHGSTNTRPGDDYDPGQWGDYFNQGYAAGQREWNSNQMMEQLRETISGFGSSTPHVPSGPSFEEQMAIMEEKEGIFQRDSLYREYIDSVSLATDYVNSQIDNEISNANLMGIEYRMTDEIKQSRLENYFASIWGEGADMELKSLVGKWGEPTGFEGYVLTRGEATIIGESPGEDSAQASARTPLPGPGAILDQAEEDTLGQSSLLGA